MTDFNTVNRYTLKEWVRHPTTIILIVAVNVIWVLIFVITDSAKDSNKDCLEQVAYLRERVEKLEKQVDDYTKAVMYKDAQIKNRDVIIDSLKYEK